MRILEHTKYDIIAPTSMGLRLSPTERDSLLESQLFHMQVTSAESNVLSVGSALGLKTKVLTAFIKDHTISARIKRNLQQRGIDFEGPTRMKNGPWDYQHQINIADSGYGLRSPEVLNQRTGEVGQTLSINDFDVDKIFVQDKTKILHISGLIAALSKSTGELCIQLVKKAKEVGTIVSFDINYRTSFWHNREDELRTVFTTIANYTDILIGNEEDFQLALGIDGPPSGGQDLHTKQEDYKQMMKSLKEVFPEVQIVATTLREVVDANTHLWGAIVDDHNELLLIDPKPISVRDRIGGGDGFVGGFLYGLVQGYTAVQAMEFGWATGVLVATSIYDYAQPVNETEIWRIWEGNARVRR